MSRKLRVFRGLGAEFHPRPVDFTGSGVSW